MVFRIRRIHDDVLPSNRAALNQVQEILSQQFPLLSVTEIESLGEKLHDPMKYRYRSIVLVAENGHGRVLGFALLMHVSSLGFSFLDFVSAAPSREGRGIGGALYERVREEAVALGSWGLFLECLPDDPALSRDPGVRKQNSQRLRFYERFGARPIAGTRYETPLQPDDDNPPYLVFDALGQGTVLRRATARDVVRAILDLKYEAICPAEYVEMVVESFQDEPVRLREPHYPRR